jgi:hypothetical protein
MRRLHRRPLSDRRALFSRSLNPASPAIAWAFE